MLVKWVVVERNFRGREAALRGISYPTKEEAEAHIVSKFPEKFRKRFHVEARELKLDDDRLRMTCQCCGRKILANLGSIALHGYERPESGWQTSSCMGAKAQPFEVDRTMLGKMIEVLHQMKARQQGVRDQIADELLPIKRSWKRGFGPKAEKMSFEFTRENFESDEARQSLHASGHYNRSFDDLLKVELGYHDSRIRAVEGDITMQQKRYDEWKQTHEWKGGQWASL